MSLAKANRCLGHAVADCAAAGTREHLPSHRLFNLGRYACWRMTARFHRGPRVLKLPNWEIIDNVDTVG